MSRSRPLVLVTGATGFAAGYLLDRLAAAPVDVVAWQRPGGTPPPPERADDAAIRWLSVDLLDAGSVAAAVAAHPPDQAYHLAGATHQGRSFGQPTDVLRVNAMGTHLVLAALERYAPHARILVTTTGFVYQPSETAVREDAPLRPASPYALSKLAQELVAQHAAETTTLQVVRCRPFNHIGPRQSADFFASSFARQIARIARGVTDPVIRVGNLTARRDLSDVRDVVRAYLALMASGTPGQVYNVCRGSAVSIRDVLDGLIAQSGLAVDVQVAPELLRPVDQPLLLGVNEKLTQATGWQPEIPLDQTLRDLLAYWGPRSDQSS